MRYVVDFKRYPRAICVLVIQYFRGDGIVTIETPCTDAYLRWLYLHDFDTPIWWQAWHSTQAWIASVHGERIAIVGSRDYPHLADVAAYVNTLPMNTVIVSGGAKGVDLAAENAAKARRMKTVIFLPDWDTHGKAAGFIRNQDIVAACDRLVAFSHNGSRGTANSIRLARQAGKQVTVYDSNGAIAA
jgi:hypothetical protein